MRIVILTLALLAQTGTAEAQTALFQGPGPHIGIGVGVFTYHGPVDLSRPGRGRNFVRENDPALILTGTFPLVRDRLFFRGLVGITNFATGDGARLVARETGQNAFLTKQVVWFEPEVVFALVWSGRRRLTPYVLTGFGAMIADPLGRTNRPDVPGSGVPGPDRSVFMLPVGAGLDWAATRRISLFAEGSYRFDLNYVFRNAPGYHRHDTSLLAGGIRIGFPTRRHRPADRPGASPAPMDVKPYAPPPLALPPPDVCPADIDLNTVYFDRDGVTFDDRARTRLDENVAALTIYAACCFEVRGYTDGGARPDRDNARHISLNRAEAVVQYYIEHGFPSEKLSVAGLGYAFPSCAKDDPGPGCRQNRRVETTPMVCW